MKVNIQDKAHLKEALRFAKKLGGKSKSSLRHGFHILNCFKRNAPKNIGLQLHIYKDFVDHSFYWSIHNDENKRYYNGGLILHGFQDTFSAELSPANYPRWSIHT